MPCHRFFEQLPVVSLGTREWRAPAEAKHPASNCPKASLRRSSDSCGMAKKKKKRTLHLTLFRGRCDYQKMVLSKSTCDGNFINLSSSYSAGK